MKPHSDKGWCPDPARFSIAGVITVMLSVSALNAQNHPWSVSGSAGISVLSLGAVDDDNAADARGWASQGYPISQFPSLKAASLYAARLSYRQDREFAVSLIALYSLKTVRASYHSHDADLDLSRGIESTDVILGVAYYPAARPYFLEWYLQATFGLTFGNATATATGVRTANVSGGSTPQPFIETDARFSKTKPSVSAGAGMDIPLLPRVALKTEALYRFAQFGVMSGTVTRFGERRDETTTIDFNYSGFLLTAGIRIEL